MLITSMGVSLDGFISDRDGRFDWSVPSPEQFAFHLEQVRGLGAILCGRRLYETMLVWETDPTLRDGEDATAFADVWTALDKVVFSRTLETVQGNARLARAPLADEIEAAVTAAAELGKDVEIGGADLAGQAIELDLVDELSLFRSPVLVGGGTPLLPPVRHQLDFELIGSRTFGSRVLYECYRRDRSASSDRG